MNGTDDLQGPSRVPGPPATVLVLLESARNRSLIRGWLESSPAYTVVTVDLGGGGEMGMNDSVDVGADADIKTNANANVNADENADRNAETETTGVSTQTLPDEFDICLLDTASLDRFADELRTYKQEAKPAYLPYVLLRSSADAAKAGFPTETGAGGGTVTGAETATDTASATETDPTSTPVEGDRSTQSRDHSTHASLIDEILTLPADWETLQYRLENLQKARRLSIELADRANQYRRLLSLLPDAVVLLDGTEITYANDRAQQLFAATASLEGQSILPFVHEPIRDRVRETVDRLKANPESVESLEVSIITADGSQQTVMLTATTVRGSKGFHHQLIFREAKSGERWLSLFEQALDVAVQGITIADAREADNPLLYANETFERITGYSTEEILGRNCRFLQGAQTDSAAVDRIREAVTAGVPVVEDILNYHRDGTPFWNRLNIVPITDVDGTVTHYLGLQQDITAQKEREQRLAVLDRILRHNLRNELTVIRGYATTLAEQADGDGSPSSQDRDGTPPTSQTERAAAEILQATDSLLELSEQVRSFQDVVTDTERATTTYDLPTTIKTAVDNLTADHPRFSASLSTPRPLPIQAHELFPTAMTDLLRLAARSPNADLECSVTIDAEMAILEIVDRGGTIPADDLTALTGQTESPLEHAEGVDLWLIRWTIEYSGGQIVVDSVDGVSRIRIQLVQSATAASDS